MDTKFKKEKKERRRTKIKAKIFSAHPKPRIAVFRSNKYLYLQLIDETGQNTIASSDTRKIKGESLKDKAKLAGIELAKKAVEKKIVKVVFDRGGHFFIGAVKSAAEGAREGGLIF